MSDSIGPVAAPHLAPTRVRYGVLCFLCTLALVLYVDRVCMGQAEKSIREQFGLSKRDMGWVAMAFTLAYMLFEVPMGHWGDRHGSRGVIARIVVWWSAFTALTGAAAGFWTLFTARFLFGAGEAGAFPNAARVVTRWFPPQDRGKARGAITTVSMIGGALTTPIAALLIVSVGWRWMFAVFGLLGVIWSVAFYFWFRDEPAQHSWTNEAERQLIAAGAANGDESAAEHAAIPWPIVLASPNVWLMGGIMTVGASLFYVLFNWFPTYLKEARGLSENASGGLMSVVMLGGAVGCVSGGYLADWVVRRTGERQWSRRIVGAGSLTMAALSVALVPACDSASAAALCSAAALFFVQLSIPTWWSVVAEISGPHGAAMFGLMNSLGGVGAMSAPLLSGHIVESLEEHGTPSLYAWIPVFVGGAGLLLAGAAAWMLVDAARSVVQSRGEPHGAAELGK